MSIYGPEEAFSDNPSSYVGQNIGRASDGFTGARPSPSADGGGRGGAFGRAMIGRMVFHAGVRSLENTLSAQSAESNAASTGDVQEYQKAQAKEYGGFIGGIRESVQHVLSQSHHAGIQGRFSDPEQQEQLLQRAVEDQQQQKAHAKEVMEGVKAQARDKEEFARQQAEMQDSIAPDSSSRESGRINREADQKIADVRSMLGGNTVEQGFGSGPEAVKKRDAYVGEMASLIERQRDAEQRKLDIAEQSADDALHAEGKEAQLRAAGDNAGAKKVAFDEEIAKKSEEAHKRSAGEGAIFDKEVAPAMQAEFAKKQNDERIANEEETQQKIDDITRRAADDRLKAMGASLSDERAMKFASLDEETAKAQLAADKETDINKKANLQKIADATRAAAESEKGSYDIEQDHKRNDEDNAMYMRSLEKAKHDADKQHRIDYEEDEAKARAAGKGAVADYDAVKEREEDRIREAEATGDPKKIAQAKRIAKANIQAFKRGHREKSQTFGSWEEYLNNVQAGAQNENGLGDAMGMADRDLRNLKGGGGGLPTAGTAGSGQAVDNAAKSLSDALQNQLKDLFKDSPQLWVAPGF